MEKLVEILAKNPSDRNDEELQYLKDHESELTDEQKSQLEEETKAKKSPACRMGGESKDECVARKIPEIMHENPNMDHDQAIAIAESMCEKECSAEEEGKEVVSNTIHESPLKKNIGQTVYKEFSTVIKETADGLLEAVINSGKEDRQGEILDIKGLDIKKYLSNPVLAYAHNYDMPSVGRAEKLTKTVTGELKALFKFATDIEGWDLPRILDQLYRKGYQFAFSIGFIPLEVDGNVYTKSQMIEFSPVLIGADDRALLLNYQKGLGLDQVKKELQLQGIDIDLPMVHTSSNMDLVEILAKEPKDLTPEEIAFVKEHASELSDEDKAKFASVLAEEVVEEKVDLAKVVGDAVEKVVAPLRAELKELKELDPIKAKNIKGTETEVTVENKELTKEEKFKLFVKGMASGDYSEYLGVVGKTAMTTTNTGEVIPPTEFVAEVERLEEEFGVAQKFASLRRTDRTSITMIKGNGDVTIYDTAEAGAKKSSKLGFDTVVLAFRKFAGISPVTDELLEDSAIDIWNELTTNFARALSERKDQLVFTETAGVGANAGVLTVSGTNAVTITGDSIEDLSYNDLSKAIWGVPTLSEKNGRFYMNREILGVVQRIVDGDGRHIWQRAMADGTPATILGKPYELVDVMPRLSDDAEETPFVIFGDLRYATLGERTGLALQVFDTGEVLDPDDEEVSINLLTQDMKAIRAVQRMNAIVRFPTAFSVISTGASVS